MQSTSVNNSSIMTEATRFISTDEESLQEHLINATVHSFISEVPSDYNFEDSTSMLRTIDELCATHKSTSPNKKRQGNHNQLSQSLRQNYNKIDSAIQTNSQVNKVIPSSKSSTYSGRGRRGRCKSRGRMTEADKETPSAPLMIMNHQFSSKLITSPIKICASKKAIDQEMNEEYQKFVNSLYSKQEFEEDDEISYQLPDDYDDDNDDDDENDDSMLEEELISEISFPRSNENSPSPALVNDLLRTNDGSQDSIYDDLDKEVGNLLEEDLLASVSNLVQQQPSGTSNVSNSAKKTALCPTMKSKYAPKEQQPTKDHVVALRQLLSQHYQLLLQQSIIAIRTAYCEKYGREYESSNFHSDAVVNESSDDLIEIVDGSIGMLQDLFDNRNDAIRNNLNCSEDNRAHLTRSAFRTTLQGEDQISTYTNFDVKGIKKLEDTKKLIDNCCGDKHHDVFLPSEEKILESQAHNEACAYVLQHANAEMKQNVLPSRYNFSSLFTYPSELMGNESFLYSTTFPLPAFDSVITKELMPKQRSQFTASEDNLILRGINLYGEKEWLLISDRFLPDRSVSTISQRYSRLCYLIYKASGVQIDPEGNLPTPPVIVDDKFNEEAAAVLNLVKAPLMYDVHRWSLEEDLTLLKAVPFFGNNWAVIRQKLIPHRDRGHLRKRYQVLERRIKGTLKRGKKEKCGSNYQRQELPQPQQEIIAFGKSALSNSSGSVKKTDLLFNTSSSESESLSNQRSSATSNQEEEVQDSSPPFSSSCSSAAKNVVEPGLKDDQALERPVTVTAGSLLCSEEISPLLTKRLARTANSKFTSSQPTTPDHCINITPNKKRSLSFVDKTLSVRPKSASSKEDCNISCLLSPSFVFATPMNLDCSLLGFEGILKDSTNSLMSRVDHFFQNEQHMTPLFSTGLSAHSKINMSGRSVSKKIVDRASDEMRNISTEVAAEALIKQPESINEVHTRTPPYCVNSFPTVLHDAHLLSALSFPDQLQGHENIVDIDISMNNENSFNCFDVSSITLEEDLFSTKRRKLVEAKDDDSSNYHSLYHINMSNVIETQQLELSHQKININQIIPRSPTPPNNYSLNEKPSATTITTLTNKRSLFDVAIGSIKNKKKIATKNKKTKL